jgi:peptidoglycan hydrolase-like protein with peptidoglycan-binding domain
MKKFIITTVLAFALATTAFAAPLKLTTLRVGSTGETVKTVQQKLIDLGFSDSAVDGKYGRKTAAAVAKFQLSKNLKSDGFVGEKTLAMILASKAPSTTQSSIDSNSMKTETVSTSVTTNNTVPVVPLKTTTDTTASRTTKPIIDVPVVIPDTIPGDAAWKILCRDRKPHVQVLSPNGNEVYSSNQQIPVTWKSCNVTSDKMVHLSIKTYQNGTQVNIGSLYSAQTGTPNVPNTGSALSRVFSDIGGIQYNPGKNYKVMLSLTNSNGSTTNSFVTDDSDNLFTINASQPKVQVGTSTTNPPASSITVSQTQTTNNVRLLVFTVKAIDGDVTLKKIPVQVNSTGSNIQNIVSQLKLVDGSGNVLQTADTVGNYISSGSISTSTGCLGKDCGFFFNNLGNIVIPNGTTKEFSIIADIRPITAATGDLTRTLKVSLTNNDVISSSNFGATNQNGDTIVANSTYRIGKALGNVITFSFVTGTPIPTTTTTPIATPDMCPNISGVQTTIPTGMIKDSVGNCVAGGVTTSTCVQTGTGSESISLKPYTTPIVSKGSKNVLLASIDIKNTGQTDICNINGIQLGSYNDTSSILQNIRTSVSGMSTQNLVSNGSYYYYWVSPIAIPLKKGTSTTVNIYGDIKLTAPDGTFQVGMFGINHDLPGAYSSGLTVLGNPITLGGLINPKTTIPSSAY